MMPHRSFRRRPARTIKAVVEQRIAEGRPLRKIYDEVRRDFPWRRATWSYVMIIQRRVAKREQQRAEQ